MEDLTRSSIRAKVQENTDPIEMVISPSDLIHQDIDSWENVDIDRLKDELHENMSEWSYQANHPYERAIHDLAVLMFREDMQRVPMEDLRFESRDKAVANAYWLYDMSKYVVREIIEENWEDMEYTHEYESDALMQIESWIMDKKLANIQ